MVGISPDGLALCSHARSKLLRVTLIFEPFLLAQKSGSLPTHAEQNKNHFLSGLHFAGGDEQKSFERLLADLADWFIENPQPAWKRQLRQASSIIYQQQYTY